MIRLNRRQFLLSAAAATLAAPLRAAFPERDAIGANTAIHGYTLWDSIALLHKIGFPAIEIHPMGELVPPPDQLPGFLFDQLSEENKRRIRRELEPFATVTAHLPYHELHYFSRDRQLAESSRRRVEVAMEGAAYFGAKLAVVHPMEPDGYSAQEGWKVMVEQFHRWGDLAVKHGLRLAAETGYPRSVHAFVQLIREIDHPAVGATVDVGHQSRYEELVAKVRPDQRATPEGIRAYNDTTLEIIDRLREKILHLHVHDIDPQTWQEHKPMRYGFVDYPRLFAKLREVNYRGVLILELGGPAASMPVELSYAKRKLEGFLEGRQSGSMRN